MRLIFKKNLCKPIKITMKHYVLMNLTNTFNNTMERYKESMQSKLLKIFISFNMKNDQFLALIIKYYITNFSNLLFYSNNLK